MNMHFREKCLLDSFRLNRIQNTSSVDVDSEQKLTVLLVLYMYNEIPCIIEDHCSFRLWSETVTR